MGREQVTSNDFKLLLKTSPRAYVEFRYCMLPSDPSDISSNDLPGLSEVMKYKFKENLIELHFIVKTTGSLVILVQVSRHATLESDLRLLHNF